MTQPTTIASYRIIRPLGAGGMARIYEALDLNTGVRVALKLLADHATDPEDLRRFRREADMVARLNHPNIITIYSAGDERGVPYIAMELLEGSLEQRIQQGPLDPDAAVRLLLPLLDALDHAHRLGLVHRDIKPANVLLRDPHTPVLADFDLARPQTPDPASRITADGDRLGTPAYMAPEQLRGEPLDARTDLYAIGAMLFELLTGRTPFDGDISQVIVGHLQKPPPPLRSLAPAASPTLEYLVERLLAKDPAARPDSAADVAAALQSMLSGAGPAPTQSPRPAAPASPAPAPVSPAPAPTPVALRPGVGAAAIAVGLVGALALLAVIVIGLARADQRQSGSATSELLLVSTAEVTVESTVETLFEIATEVSTVSERPTRVTESEPDPTPGPTEEVEAPPDGRLAEVGATLLTDPQVILSGGATYVIGSVGISEVADTGVYIMFAELLTSQPPAGRASLAVTLRDAEGRALASGTGVTITPMVGPLLSSAVIIPLIPDGELDLAQIAATEFQVAALSAPGETTVGLLADPGVQVEELAGAVPTYRLRGSLRNISEGTVSAGRAVALLYDEEFRVIAVEDTALLAEGRRLQPGETVEFDITIFSLGAPAAGFRIYAVGE